METNSHDTHNKKAPIFIKYKHIDGTIMVSASGIHIEFHDSFYANKFIEDMNYYFDMGALEIDGENRYLYAEIRRRHYGQVFEPPKARNNKAL